MKADKTDTKKGQMLEALERSLGVVTTACKQCNVGRSTYYEWLSNDAHFAEQVQEIADVALDFAESNLFKLVKDGNTTAIIFYLKTKGKQRGYVERTEVHNTDDSALQWDV